MNETEQPAVAGPVEPTVRPSFDRIGCSQCGGEFGPGNSGYSHCSDHQQRNNVTTTTPTPYADHLAPHKSMQRDLKFGGAWFEVCIDCQEPDEPGEVTHPENYFIEGVKLGGVWWGAEDALSTYMLECLNDALKALIAEEHREALKA